MSGSLCVSGLSRRWPGFAFTGVDLELVQGEYFVLLGPTGAGKTLLMETVMGFHEPDSGHVSLGGGDVTLTPPERRGIGYVPQAPTLFPHMTVRGNIEFGLMVQGFMEEERRSRSGAVAKVLDIAHLLDRLPSGLSGGERQKVQLARALVMEPGLLLLDEPLSNVDAHAQGELRLYLKRIQREMRVTVLHVTHSHVEARTLADRVGVMWAGKLVQLGSVPEVYGSPMNPETAGFLGFENLFRVSQLPSGASWLRELIGSVDADADWIGWRAESTYVSGTTSEGAIEAKVLEVADLGAYRSVLLEAGIKVRASVPLGAGVDLRVGGEAYLGVDAESVRVW
ncbi:ATP-binding cassette domain-containing protein [Candidatus Bathyarchaeota archaeon]|nr:ATP-binding cassette domain-containing protein [Candidatus Bathyarchaeota archaeon]